MGLKMILMKLLLRGKLEVAQQRRQRKEAKTRNRCLNLKSNWEGGKRKEAVTTKRKSRILIRRRRARAELVKRRTMIRMKNLSKCLKLQRELHPKRRRRLKLRK